MYLVLVKHTGLYTLGKQRIPWHLLGNSCWQYTLIHSKIGLAVSCVNVYMRAGSRGRQQNEV